MKEIEVWGVLNRKQFESKLKEFTSKFGKPKLHKRLAIQVLDADDTSLWTRIRITDGRAEIMQKVGEWSIGEQEEISVNVKSEVSTVYKCFKMLNNLLSKRRLQIVIIQHENYIFENGGFEIKLSHQFGKSDKYPFEIESDKGIDEILSFAKKLDLKPDTNNKGEEFWNKWNEKVNLDGMKMSDKEIKSIIKKYI